MHRVCACVYLVYLAVTGPVKGWQEEEEVEEC